MRTALTGAGVIGSVHAAILQKRGELCAVCDIDEKKLEKYASLPVYTDYVRMLDEVKPDAVHICTPHYLHAQMICEALSRGVHTLCEKPLCISLDEIEKIKRAAEKSEANFGVCLQNRYNGENLYIKEYLKDKKIVSVTGTVAWHRDGAYYASAPWRGKQSTEGGGVLINQALHTLDLVLWLTGAPETVTASVSNLTLQNAIEVEDSAVIIGKGKPGFVFFATNGSPADMPVELTVKTDDEIIKVTPGSVVINGEAIRFREKYEALGKKCYGSGHEALINDFYDCISNGRKFAIGAEEAARSVKVILAAYASGGKPVRLD